MELRDHTNSQTTIAVEIPGDDRSLPALDDTGLLTLEASTADTFWTNDYTSTTAQRLKMTRCTKDNVRRRILKEKNENQNPLNLATATGSSIHKSEDIFPSWMIESKEFEEVDRLIKLNRLDNALNRAPHARSDEDAKVVGAFLVDSWKTAAELGDEGVGLLSRRVTMIKLSKGDYILTQNKESQKFYIIVRGKVDVHRIEAVKNDGNPRDGIVATLGPGREFGESAVKNGTLCNASCIAHTDSVTLLVLTKTDYDHIMADVLSAAKQDNMDVLKSIPMFRGWGRSKLESVERQIRRVVYPAGEDIMKQGDPPDNVYFISSGKIRISKDIAVKTVNTWPTGPRSWKRVTRSVHKSFFLIELGRGGFFGEKAIVEDSVRAATCTSSTEVLLLSLDKTDFMQLLNQGHKSHTEDVKQNVAHGYPDDTDILRLWTTLGGVKKKETPPKLSKTANRLASKLVREKKEKAAKNQRAQQNKRSEDENTVRYNTERMASTRPQTTGGGIFKASNSISGASQLTSRWAPLRMGSQEGVELESCALSRTLPIMNSALSRSHSITGSSHISNKSPAAKKPAFAKAFEQTHGSMGRTPAIIRPRSAAADHAPARLAFSRSVNDMRSDFGAYGELSGSGNFRF